MTLFLFTALSIVAAVACAQPQADPARTSKAITLIGNTAYLYGGSDTAGNCYSDLYSLNLDPANGWVAGQAPWQKVGLGSGSGQLLGQNSWAVPSTDGTGLLFYGQTLCPQNLAANPSTADHTYTSTSGMISLHSSGKSWSVSSSNTNVLGPRLVKDDSPYAVQVFDTDTQVAYVFVYDIFNQQLGTQLWNFAAGQLPTNTIVEPGHNTTMITSQPTETPVPSPTAAPTTVAPTAAPTTAAPAPTGTGGPIPTGTAAPPPAPSAGPGPAPPASPAPAPPAQPQTPPAAANAPVMQNLVRRAPTDVTVAPFVDIGCAVYSSGTIVVLGGGKSLGTPLSGDDVDPSSGYYKLDRCWVYNIQANTWQKQMLTGPAGGSLPLPRRLAALLAVGKNQIYMHGGNTTQTNPLTGYSNELWILNTDTWTWSQGAQSVAGRSSHTLIMTNNEIVSLSGFEFLTSPTKAASNAFPMIYSLGSSTWGTQFGTITPSWFSQHGVAVIAGSVGGFLAIVIVASVFTRLCRRRGARRGNTAAFAGFNSRKPFTTNSNVSSEGLATSAAAVSGTGAASRLSGMRGDSNNLNDSQIDLSALPRNSDATMYDLPLHQNQYSQKQFSPYQQQQAQFSGYNPAQIQQQQQVPLMSANELEQQGSSFSTPYRDDDDTEVKDQPRGSAIQFATSTSPPHSFNMAGSRQQSIYTDNNNAENARPMVHSPPDRGMSTDSYNNSRVRSNSSTSIHSAHSMHSNNGSSGNFYGNNNNTSNNNTNNNNNNNNMMGFP